MITSEEVDILSAVDADQPLAYAVLVPVSAGLRSVSELGQSEKQAYFTESDILEDSENSDSVGLPYAAALTER